MVIVTFKTQLTKNLFFARKKADIVIREGQRKLDICERKKLTSGPKGGIKIGNMLNDPILQLPTNRENLILKVILLFCARKLRI